MALPLPLFAVAKVTAALLNGLVNVLNLSPTSQIVPTAAFTGTSGTVSTNGLITFNACTVVSVDAAFTSTFRRHLITIQTLNNTGTGTFIFRTTAPADDTSTKYDFTSLLGQNAVAASATVPSATSWPVALRAVALIEADFALTGVAVAAPTTGFLDLGAHSNPAVQNTNDAVGKYYITQQELVAFGGFKVTFTAACSGTIRIVGEY